MVRKNTFLVHVLSFAMGLGGCLYIAAPSLGFIAMLDLASYVVAVPLIFMLWGRMGRNMHRALIWAFAWTCASMLANFMNFVDFKFWAKCVVVASSSWTIMTVAYFVLKDAPRGYLWYLIGAGIGGWISLYHFRNGALEAFATKGDLGGAGYGLENLMDKQIFPVMAAGLFHGGFLTLFLIWKKMPVLIISGGALFAGFWLLLHGGSRSSFGVYCAAALAGCMVVYGKKMFVKMAKHPFLMLVLAGMGISILFGGYAMMAKGNMLEAGESAKFENEFGKEGGGALNGRAGFKFAVEDAKESYLIGKGWQLRNHSVIFNSLACEGVLGFAFWVYFYCQVLWWCCHRLPYSGRNATFILVMMVSTCWAVFGSPFGARHKFFVMMAFIALCRDSSHYGVGYLFSNDILIWRPFRRRFA